MSLSIKEEILKYFRTKHKRRYHLPLVGWYYPSVLVNPCLKSQYNYYVISEREGKIPDKSVLQMGEGTVWHDIIQSFPVWDKTEVFVEKTIKSGRDKFVIMGSADAVKDNVVYEFKRTGYIPHKPRFHNLLQLNFYMEALGKPKGILVYIGKHGDEFDIIEHYWTLSDWHTSHLVNRAIQLHSALKHKEVPNCCCRSRVHDIEFARFLDGK